MSDREKVIKGFETCTLEDKALSEYQPKIVRCKDCKYQHDPRECSAFGMDRYDDWFCADGERRDDDG